MDIEGKYAVFTPEEQQITGFGEKHELRSIDVFDLYSLNNNRQIELKARMTADDDDLLHYERAAILPDALRLKKDKQIIDKIADQIVTAQVELKLFDVKDDF